MLRYFWSAAERKIQLYFDAEEIFEWKEGTMAGSESIRTATRSLSRNPKHSGHGTSRVLEKHSKINLP